MHKVVLIGQDHHNGLGLVRSFGVHGIKPYGIIIGPKAHKGFLRHSKYWQQVWFATDEQHALEILLKQNFSDKPVLIPFSDGAAQSIDLNLNQLSKKYICPSIGGKQGEIARLMDKMEQTQLAQRLELEVLPSQIIELANPHFALALPVIVKPVVSAEGQKSDINICITQDDLLNVLKLYRDRGYQRALVQTYLSNYSEYTLVGSLFEKNISFTIVKNLRQWPVNIGTGSLLKFSTEKEVRKYTEKVALSLLDLGYQGPIDVEFFRDNNNNKFYLNEINWRNSGHDFVSLYNRVHSAYYYYCACTKTPLPEDEPLINTYEGYSMNEATDLRHVIFGNLPLKSWLKDCKHTHSFALWYGKDLKPTFARYMDLILKNFTKRM